MRRIAVGLLILFAFAVPWEYSLDLGEPWGNVARVLGLLVLLAGVPVVLMARKLRPPRLLEWLVLGLYLYFLCSWFWTVDLEGTAEKARAYFQVMMMVWLTLDLPNHPRDLLGLFRAFTLGCWLLAILTFVDFSSASAMAAQQIRFVAEGQDPNDVARFLDLGFPLAALLFAVERSWLVRVAALLYLPAGLLAVLLTASRGGFSGSLLALAGSAGVLVMSRPRGATRVLAGIVGMAGALWLFVPQESLDRLATIPEQIGSADLNDRLSIWVAGWRAFVHAPWLGYGAGAYATASRLAEGDTAHNTLMAILVTGGLVGMGWFLAILLAVGWSVFRTRGLLRIALGTAFSVWLVTAMVGSVEENRTTWLLFGMIALTGRLTRENRPAMALTFGAGLEGFQSQSAGRKRVEAGGPGNAGMMGARGEA